MHLRKVLIEKCLLKNYCQIKIKNCLQWNITGMLENDHENWFRK